MVPKPNSDAPSRIQAAIAASVLVIGLALASCNSPNGIGGTGETDTSFSDLSIGGMAGAASSGDATTGVAFLGPRGPMSWTERFAGLFEIERVANAATFSCTTAGNWGSPTGSTIQFNPMTGCTITYANGTEGTYNVTGSWTFTFGGSFTTVVQGGAVSNNPTGTTVTRTVTSGTFTKTYTGPLGHIYAVTENTASCTPWTGSVTCGGDLTTCTAPGCPHVGLPGGARSVVLQGMQITGTKDGATFYDHTVASTAPILITGFGANRVISTGTIVVYHNLAHLITTTTINGPLTHEAGCAYPVSGSVTTAISGGAFNGESETVTFTSKCGIANLASPDGSTSKLQLHVVL